MKTSLGCEVCGKAFAHASKGSAIRAMIRHYGRAKHGDAEALKLGISFKHLMKIGENPLRQEEIATKYAFDRHILPTHAWTTHHELLHDSLARKERITYILGKKKQQTEVRINYKINFCPNCGIDILRVSEIIAGKPVLSCPACSFNIAAVAEGMVISNTPEARSAALPYIH